MPEEKEKPQETAENEPEKKAKEGASSGKPLKILIIAGVLIVQIAGSYFLQKTFFFQPSAHAGLVKEKKEKVVEEEADERPTSVIMLDELVVNPAGTVGRRYLAVTLGIQTPTENAEEEIGSKSALLRDGLIMLLSSKELDDLADVQYRDTLKMEIQEVLAEQLKDIEISNIVFSGYVIQ